MEKLRLMFVFGTRPEAVKLAPLILKARQQPDVFEPIVVATAQHRQMLDDVLCAFEIKPDTDLNIMTPGQSLYVLTSRIIAGMETVLSQYKPDWVVVQGDTTTTFSAALAGYYAGIKIAHVEAGLRTGDRWAPFPEEMNRKMTSSLADIHFAPTEGNKQNLLREGYSEETIFITGNTVIDALLHMVEQIKKQGAVPASLQEVASFPRLILVTGHRRENFGEPLKEICLALRDLALKNPETALVYPVHLNPQVQKAVSAALQDLENVFLLPPLPYPEFVWLMQRCDFIISDSGGIQEEAPALGKPVLVTRNVTERPEALRSGGVRLVGNKRWVIAFHAQSLLDDENLYRTMATSASPYGDGKAAERILDILRKVTQSPKRL